MEAALCCLVRFPLPGQTQETLNRAILRQLHAIEGSSCPAATSCSTFRGMETNVDVSTRLTQGDGHARISRNDGAKRVGRSQCRPRRLCIGDYTACFNSLLARKATLFEALILIVSPVAGFRPIRAARLRT